MTREEYEKIIDEKLKAVKEELMADYGLDGWKVGDKYYFHDTTGNIIACRVRVDSTNNGSDINSIDTIRIKYGYAKHTEEEVKFQFERDAVLYELSKYAEPKDAVWDGTKSHCLITWDFWEGGISVKSICTYKSNDIYFSTREDAEKAIQAVGEDRIKKYYLQVED